MDKKPELTSFASKNLSNLLCFVKFGFVVILCYYIILPFFGVILFTLGKVLPGSEHKFVDIWILDV